MDCAKLNCMNERSVTAPKHLFVKEGLGHYGKKNSH